MTIRINRSVWVPPGAIAAAVRMAKQDAHDFDGEDCPEVLIRRLLERAIEVVLNDFITDSIHNEPDGEQ